MRTLSWAKASSFSQRSPKAIQKRRLQVPGLLAVALIELDGGNPYVAPLKIRYRDVSFVRIIEDAPTQLRLKQIDNILLSEIQ